MPTGVYTLSAVSAVSSTDAWAVGTAWIDHAADPVILRWNGTAWSIADALPSRHHHYPDLRSIVALGADDVWAAGRLKDYGSTPDSTPLILHWDGSAWQQIEVPALADAVTLDAIAADHAGDVWTVGASYPASGPVQPFTERWDGTQWLVVDTPAFADDSQLLGVSVLASDDAWAVGVTGNDRLLLHWDGSAWSVSGHPAK